jgi:uncharacterized membrane protein
MRTISVVHAVMAVLGLLSGYAALYSAKGGRLHRKSGMVFVYVMVTMALLGVVLSAVLTRAPAPNIAMGFFTSYLAITGLTAVKPPAAGARRLHLGGLLLVAALTAAYLTFGIQAVANGGHRYDTPALPMFVFGGAALLAAIGDVRILRSGQLRGAKRIARHLWRLSFALLIGAISSGRIIPKSFHTPLVLALPAVAVLVPLLYWLWRAGTGRTLRGRGSWRSTGTRSEVPLRIPTPALEPAMATQTGE